MPRIPAKQALSQQGVPEGGTPRHLIALWDAGLRPAWVAVDTETSGLFADDGARVSTASVAWPDPDREWGPDRFNGLSWGVEAIAPGVEEAIVSVAWPFDQGRDGKPEQGGRDTLWPDAHNLPVEEWLALLDWLQRVGSLTMHNEPFDVEKLRVGVRRFNEDGVAGVDLVEIVDWDTQNVNDLLWGWEPTGLKPTLGRLWPDEKLEDEAEKVKEYLRRNKLPKGRWDLMPWDIIGKYADLDARGTARLKLRQQWEIATGAAGWHGGRDRVAAAVERRMQTSKVLTRMTHRGLPYHEDLSYAAAEKARTVMVALASPLPFDPTKDADIRAYYFSTGKTSKGVDGLDLTPYAVTAPTKRFPEGQSSVTAEVVGRMIADEQPWAVELAAWQRVATAESMWYRGYADKTGPDGRLRTSFRQNGARSTRFSVERVNLQAIPQDYRFSGVASLEGIPTPRQIIAAAIEERYPGWALFDLDLAQAELRIASLYARAENMIEMIKAGSDLHGYTTQQLFGIRPGEARWGEYRQVGKRGNFSLCFGASGKTFRQMLAEQAGIRWSLDACNKAVWDWRRLYPAFVGADGRGGAVARHARKVEERQRRHARLAALDGATGGGIGYLSFRNKERRWFQPYEEAHKAFNQRVQGDQAQFGIDWLLRVDALLRDQGMDDLDSSGRWAWSGTRGGMAGLLLPVHDSQMLLLPAGDEGQAMAEACADLGRELWTEWFPGMPGEIEVKTW